MKTCAIFDLFSVHDHVIPSHIDYLQRLGYRVTVFSPTKDFRDATKLLPDLEYAVTAIASSSYEKRGIPSLRERYLNRFRSLDVLQTFDLVVLNTFRMELPVTSAISEACKNVVAVLHTPRHNIQHARYREFIRRGHRGVVLSRNLGTMFGVPWVAPLTYVGAGVSLSRKADIRRTFCVPGTVRFTGRTYLALVRAVQSLKRRGRKNFVVKILGRHRGQDGLSLRRAIKDASVEDCFEFLADTSHERFLTEAMQADCILPIIDSTVDSMGAPHYFEVITSSIFLALGLGRPTLCEKRLAEAYDLAGAGFTHDSGGLEAGLAGVLDATPDALMASSQRTGQLRRRLFEESLHNFGRVA